MYLNNLEQYYFIQQMLSQNSDSAIFTPNKKSFSSTKKSSETLDCNTSQSKFTQIQSLHLSNFSTASSLKRVNQIEPKSKILIPHKETLASKNQLKQSKFNKKQSKISLNYESLKTSIFNWRLYVPLCGVLNKLGQDGCLCGNPCPLLKQWTKHYKTIHAKLYQQLPIQNINKSQETQIEKDIIRTYSECLTFTNNLRFQQMLREVLMKYSVYDPQVGYVQGMNIIAGIILYHLKNAQITFWAFVDLMDDQQLRMIYLPGFKFLNLHQERILTVIDINVHDLMEKMNQLSINPASFLNGWILSLLGICIPLQYMHLLIQKFRKLGWKFIYQIIITFLLFLKQSLMQAQDQSEFLMCLDLKSCKEYGDIWKEIIENAVNLKLNFQS